MFVVFELFKIVPFLETKDISASLAFAKIPFESVMLFEASSDTSPLKAVNLLFTKISSPLDNLMVFAVIVFAVISPPVVISSSAVPFTSRVTPSFSLTTTVPFASSMFKVATSVKIARLSLSLIVPADFNVNVEALTSISFPIVLNTIFPLVASRFTFAEVSKVAFENNKSPSDFKLIFLDDKILSSRVIFPPAFILYALPKRV